MGLCKCPERKITNIFCYEHRVNVCDNCLMHNHTNCVVDTYRNWITDSVYSSKCTLCDHELVENETIRLLCYHIVHWECLDSWCRSLPATTAPAGYSCPVCKKMCLFPALNQKSIIADALRQKMGQVNWARAGLGLPLLEEEVAPPKKIQSNGFQNDGTLRPNYLDHDIDKRSDVSDSSIPFESPNSSLSNFHRHSSPDHHQNHPQTHAVHDENTSYSKLHQSYASTLGTPGHYYSDNSAVSPLHTNPRKSVKSDYETPLFIDEDDHKYRRRSPFESLSRWLKNLSPAAKRRANRRRALYIVLSAIVILILLMLIFGKRDEDDGFKSNPNVLIGEGPPLSLDK